MIDDINVIIANMGGMAINTDKKTSNHLMSSNVRRWEMISFFLKAY